MSETALLLTQLKLKKIKQNKCFGNFENYDMSWHCKGCVIKEECKEAQNEAYKQG